jgi:hypothetical protein
VIFNKRRLSHSHSYISLTKEEEVIERKRRRRRKNIKRKSHRS